MLHALETYDSIKMYRLNRMKEVSNDYYALNQLHDQVMQQVVAVAQEEVRKKWGIAPTSSAFFVMGSAGRFEQTMWSDQDHGLIYQGNNTQDNSYFRELGEEITKALHIVGYSLCEGKVMSSNPLWCKSKEEWKQQLEEWMEKESFESIRYLLIFFDGRVLVGPSAYLDELKDVLYTEIKKTPFLLQRMLANTMHIKKGLGVFGQFLVELSGRHSGSIHLKERVFFPYVNSLRLLAIKEGIKEPSTVGRLEQLVRLEKYEKELQPYKQSFLTLLELRLRMQKTHGTAMSAHYLHVQSLNKEEKQELKEILRNAAKLHRYTMKVIEKGC